MPTFRVDTKPAFLNDLVLLPRSVQKRAIAALKALETDPFSAHGQAKKIFTERFKNLYRTRIADYRLIYCVGDGCVAALSIGHRKDIYDRFAPPDLTTVAGPSAEPIAIPPAYGVAPIADAPSVPDPEPTPAPVVEEPLPPPDRTPGFFRQLLAQWGVPADTHDAIMACQSIDELIELGLPDEIVERVLH
ncbi:MAG: type II toxin-antitoxin system RelE/ParE family toxin, partial [Dehalococcoidia bacterium]|nr:type II toxin-antitoxin system RelE/ParE family toxin [Dehalococcoidia bacterium]